MNNQIESCMQQIATLTEIVATLKDDCFELQQTNEQLLRQHAATQTNVALLRRSIEKLNEFRIDTTAEMETLEYIPFYQPTQRLPHCSRSLDGNTPIRKLRDDLATELESKRN